MNKQADVWNIHSIAIRWINHDWNQAQAVQPNTVNEVFLQNTNKR